MKLKKMIYFCICILALFNFTNVNADTWWVEVKCTLKSIENMGMEHRNGEFVYGKGSGNTQSKAKKAALKNVNSNYVPHGTHAKHCREINSFLQKFIIQLENINQ